MNKKKLWAIIGGVAAGIIGVGAAGAYIDSQLRTPTLYGVQNISSKESVVFNSKFLSFAGENKISGEIRKLIALIDNSNETNKISGDNHIITYIGPSKEEIKGTKMYQVNFEYDNEFYINEIKVTVMGE